MPTVIQVTGLPGAGKSTAINKYISSLDPKCPVEYLDIANFTGNLRVKEIYSRIAKAKHTVILESAIGLNCPSKAIIRLACSIDTVSARLLSRDGNFNHRYLTLLNELMITPTDIIESPEDLPEVLNNVLWG